MKSRVQLAVGIAVAAAVIVLGVMIWADRMQPISITILSPPEETIQVSVTGAVQSPGVVKVASGSRLLDVVEAAGGFTDDANTDVLNLAGRVGDGEQIVIPAIGETAQGPGPALPASGVIDLNSASIAELDELPGIGEVLAGRIIDYREQHGPFTSVDELSRIEGISPRLVDEIRPHVTVSPGG